LEEKKSSFTQYAKNISSFFFNAGRYSLIFREKFINFEVNYSLEDWGKISSLRGGKSFEFCSPFSFHQFSGCQGEEKKKGEREQS
jgi:hypothetical protein